MEHGARAASWHDDVCRLSGALSCDFGARDPGCGRDIGGGVDGPATAGWHGRRAGSSPAGGLSESVSASGAVPGAMFRGGFSGVCRGISRPGMNSVPWWWKPVRTRAGTCLRAANFVCAGRTKGRQDRHHRAAKTVNGCAVWIGDASWEWVRSILPGSGDGLDAAVWAANEFGGAPLGDKRLSARLVKSAALLASCPGFREHGCRQHGDQCFLPPDREAGGECGGEHSCSASGAHDPAHPGSNDRAGDPATSISPGGRDATVFRSSARTRPPRRPGACMRRWR